MWYYNSSIRVLTHNPCIGRWCSNHWTTREVLLCLFKNDQFYSSSMLQIIGIHCLPISVFHLISSRTWISVILYLHQKLWFPDPTTSSIVSYYLRYSYSIPWTPFPFLVLFDLLRKITFFFFWTCTYASKPGERNTSMVIQITKATVTKLKDALGVVRTSCLCLNSFTSPFNYLILFPTFQVSSSFWILAS